jgi:hypothetical protein
MSLDVRRGTSHASRDACGKGATRARHARCVVVAALLVAHTLGARAGALPCESKLAAAALPQRAFYLPEPKAAQLGATLAEHGAVRLDPHGDYSGGAPITLRSNQELYGLASTKVPDIVIAAGAENVVVSGVWNDKISFPASDEVTSKNCFNSVRTSLFVDRARLESNLFTDFQGGIVSIDDSRGGYLRNNRFVKTLTHTAWPALTLLGNDVEASYGNHFVWTNILGPLGDGVVIDGQKDVAFTGIDIESWSRGRVTKQNVVASHPAAFNVSNTEFVSVLMSHGGNLQIADAQYFGLDARNVLLLGSDVMAQTRPGLVLGPNVERLVAVNTSAIGHSVANPATEVVELYGADGSDIRRDWAAVPRGEMPASTSAAVQDLLRREQAIYRGWDKPAFPEPVSAPPVLGGTTVHEDGTKLIQTLIDRQGIARLAPGVYRLSRSLALKDGQGIVGAGRGATILVADDPGMDLIVGANHIEADLEATWFVLADLTLQGGANGIHHAPSGSGGGAQYHRAVISHVTFRGMRDAGIFLDAIYGWDNNFLDNVDFVDCGAAWRQRPSPGYTGGDVPGTTYMDKNVCYRCRFERNTVALDMPGKRGNGLNAFIDSEFRGNGKVLTAIHPLANFFANSVFVDNGGNPSFETDRSLGFVNVDFVRTIPGAVFQRYVFCDACSFDLRDPKASIVVAEPGRTTERNFFINSAVDPSVRGAVESGLILRADAPSIERLEAPAP